MKKSISLLCVVALVVACSDDKPAPPPLLDRGGYNPSGVYPPRDDSAETSATATVSAISIDEKMATLAFDQTPTKVQLTRATAALDNAKALCVESRNELADRAYVVAKILLGKDVSANSVEILEGVATTNADTIDGFLNAKERPHVCSETMAAYAVARISGMTHTDAVLGGRGVLLLPQRLQSLK